MKESEEQIAYFQWAAHVPELRWAFHVPNGGTRNKREAVNLKRQGVKSGVSDIFIPLARGGFHGLFIELKVGKNRPTENQWEFMRAVEANGYATSVCYGAAEAIRVTKQYLRGKKENEK